jgi:hypothetical protein
MYILYFSAESCRQCQLFNATWELIKQNNPNPDIIFQKIEYNNNESFFLKYNITTVPTIMKQTQNGHISLFSGPRNETTLTQFIYNNIS